MPPRRVRRGIPMLDGPATNLGKNVGTVAILITRTISAPVMYFFHGTLFVGVLVAL